MPPFVPWLLEPEQDVRFTHDPAWGNFRAALADDVDEQAWTGQSEIDVVDRLQARNADEEHWTLLWDAIRTYRLIVAGRAI